MKSVVLKSCRLSDDASSLNACIINMLNSCVICDYDSGGRKARFANVKRIFPLEIHQSAIRAAANANVNGR